ncbi:hypothetical protein NEOKW01_1914 [Nematocida sp. AWRm80]|nr:hypothetical protein NEOKW01_1914 [Nematocida sp. AWRm80]
MPVNPPDVTDPAVKTLNIFEKALAYISDNPILFFSILGAIIILLIIIIIYISVSHSKWYKKHYAAGLDREYKGDKSAMNARKAPPKDSALSEVAIDPRTAPEKLEKK